MAWDVNTGVRVDSLLTAIQTNLTDHGWTLFDGGAYNVYTSTNDQGVDQYVQITNVGAYQYLQFQAWRTWDAGTHAGTDGSGTTYNRLYYAGAAVPAATLVDMYMSTNANRFIIFINGYSNFRNWAYFGGLDSLAGVNDPFCVLLLASYAAITNNIDLGYILAPAGGGTYWSRTLVYIPMCSGIGTAGVVSTSAAIQTPITAADITKFLAFPLPIVDSGNGYFIRGCLDGMLYLPSQNGSVGHMDIITISGVTYLMIVPGGNPGTNYPAITGAYYNGLAIAEA